MTLTLLAMPRRPSAMSWRPRALSSIVGETRTARAGPGTATLTLGPSAARALGQDGHRGRTDRGRCQCRARWPRRACPAVAPTTSASPLALSALAAISLPRLARASRPPSSTRTL